MNYYDYLLNKKWLKKRERILNRDNHKCTACGSDKKLCVHHTLYIDNRKPWEYPDRTLITLCNSCHYKWHTEHETPVVKKRKRKKARKGTARPLKKAKPFESTEPRYRKKVNGEWQIINKE
jgi:5-methylcytosine-specific restriction endonuclease McrA